MSTTTLASQPWTSLLHTDSSMTTTKDATTIPSGSAAEAEAAAITSSCRSCRLQQQQQQQQQDLKLAHGPDEQEVDETDSSSMSSTEEEEEEEDVTCECDYANERWCSEHKDCVTDESSPARRCVSSAESLAEPTELQLPPPPVLPISSGTPPPVQHSRRSILKPFAPQDILVKPSKSVWLCLPPPACLPTAPTNLRTGTQTRTPNPTVTFTDVYVRSYDQTIGDNPSVGYGPPITLDWSFVDNAPVSVHDYETFRPSRRSPHQMMLSCYHRRNLLAYQCGASAPQLKHAEQMANKCKWQRTVTRTFLPAQVLEEGWETATRQLKKRLTRSKQPAAAAAVQAK